MSHVVIEKHGFVLTILVDDVPVLETALDLRDGVVLDLTELIELLEEVSDDAVEYIWTVHDINLED